MTKKQKAVLNSFLVAGLAAMFASMSAILVGVGVDTFGELQVFLSSLTVSGIVGFITGFISAGYTHFNFKK